MAHPAQERGGPYWRGVHCEAVLDRARFLFDQGLLTESLLAQIEEDGRQSQLRIVVREVLRLRGTWLAERGEWERAADQLGESVRMAREVGIHDAVAEARLLLAQVHLGHLNAPAQVAERMAADRGPAQLPLGLVWLAIGDTERATAHALAAYRWAWADGEPYVRWFDLERARRLLEELGTEVPILSSYDPANDPELPWEADVRAFMDMLPA